jgi:hypothetical protein
VGVDAAATTSCDNRVTQHVAKHDSTRNAAVVVSKLVFVTPRPPPKKQNPCEAACRGTCWGGFADTLGQSGCALWRSRCRCRCLPGLGIMPRYLVNRVPLSGESILVQHPPPP